MSTIYVTNLFDLEQYASEERPQHLISIIQPEFQPPRPSSVDPDRHLRIAVHDIAAPVPGQVAPDEGHIQALIEYLTESHGADESLMVHCYAGVSRSTAVGLIAHTVKSGDPHGSARALRLAAPHAKPNRLIISLADEVLGCDGELRDAAGQLEPERGVRVAPLIRLPMPGH